MTTLLRKMLKNNSKHKKLSEEWVLAECESEGWWRDSKSKSRDEKGEVRYAGTVAVERSASAPATATAVRSALHTAKSSNKKMQRVSLEISPKGIVVTDADSQDNVLSLSIYRISYCSADAANARVFAVVEGRQGNGGSTTDSHVAHVFVCSRRKHARALALSLAHAFNDAFQAWQSNQAGTTKSEGKSDPWVQFDEESDDEDVEAESWNTVAPLVTFA